MACECGALMRLRPKLRPCDCLAAALGGWLRHAFRCTTRSVLARRAWRWTIGKIAPAAGISWVVYEETRIMLKCADRPCCA